MHMKMAIALIPLLLLLGWLQYRMVGKVSRAEEHRTRAGLKTAVKRFANHFDQELTHIWVSFVRSPSRDSNPGQFCTEQWEAWREEGEFPGLISQIYQIKRLQGGSYGTALLNTASAEFEPCPWPEMLTDLQERLAREKNLMKMFNSRTVADPEKGLLFAPVHIRRGRHGPDLTLALVLDLDYMERVMFPDLTARYINPEGRDDFVVTIRDAHKDLVYQSSERRSTGAVDESVPFFGENHFLRNTLEGREERVRGERGREERGERRRIPGVGRMLRHRMDTHPKEDKLTWTLEASHRAGSLEAYLAVNRHHNLALNFAVLAILGVSMGLLVRSTHKARRLANQQLEFVAGVSHELLTPLAAIRSAGQNLSDGVVSGGDRVRRYGKMIEKEGGRLADLVEKVLAFSGMKSARNTYEMEHLPLAPVLNEVLGDHQVVFQEAGFTVETRVPEDLPPLLADRAALKKVIGNLAANAVKYASVDPRLFIRAREEGAHVVMEFEDCGPGVNPEDLPHIFEPFYRGKGVRDAQIKGSGLGLCLVRNMARAHGGDVQAGSGSEGGALFKVTWPKANGNQEDRVVGKPIKNHITG